MTPSDVLVLSYESLREEILPLTKRKSYFWAIDWFRRVADNGTVALRFRRHIRSVVYKWEQDMKVAMARQRNDFGKGKTTVVS